MFEDFYDVYNELITLGVKREVTQEVVDRAIAWLGNTREYFYKTGNRLLPPNIITQCCNTDIVMEWRYPNGSISIWVDDNISMVLAEDAPKVLFGNQIECVEVYELRYNNGFVPDDSTKTLLGFFDGLHDKAPAKKETSSSFVRSLYLRLKSLVGL